jgi:hypothetical protein
MECGTSSEADLYTSSLFARSGDGWSSSSQLVRQFRCGARCVYQSLMSQRNDNDDDKCMLVNLNEYPDPHQSEKPDSDLHYDADPQHC